MLASLYSLKGDNRYFYYLKYKNKPLMERESLVAYQNARLKKFLRYCYKNIPYYSAIFKRAGLKARDINGIECLRFLPVLTKGELRKHYGEIINSNLKLIECNTGGSTGTPLKLYKDRRFSSISRAVQMRNHAFFAGWMPAEKSIWIWGAVHELDPHKARLMERLKWRLNNNIVLNAYAYSEAAFDEWIKVIKCQRPTALYGYASATKDFAEYIEEKKIDIRGIIKKVITSAEALENRRLIERAFGAKVFDQYGCREVLPIAEECKFGTMHIAEDFVYVEIEDDGRVLLTPFESYGMPLLRYEVGDKVEISDNGTCCCGTSFKGMKIKICRQPVNLKNSEGKSISGCCTLLDIVSLGLGITECQIIQNSADTIQLNIVKNDTWKEEHRQIIYNYMNKAFLGTRIDFNFQDRILPEASGKKISVKSCLN
jgi:phenylacetate-CoA ligase